MRHRDRLERRRGCARAAGADDPRAHRCGRARRDALPFGPFDPQRHRTFETSLRDHVEEQTALSLGYIEQLYTFGNRGRHREPGEETKHLVSVGYLALARAGRGSGFKAAGSRSALARLVCLSALGGLARWPAGPDRRDHSAGLSGWAEAAEGDRATQRRARMRLAFGLDDIPWTRSAYSNATSCSMKRSGRRSAG